MTESLETSQLQGWHDNLSTFLHLEVSLGLFLLTDSWQSCSPGLLFWAAFWSMLFGPKHSVTLCLTILFLNPPVPNPASFALAHGTCRALEILLWTWLELLSLLPIKTKGYPNMREKSGNKCHIWWGISETDSLRAGGSTALWMQFRAGTRAKPSLELVTWEKVLSNEGKKNLKQSALQSADWKNKH